MNGVCITKLPQPPIYDMTNLFLLATETTGESAESINLFEMEWPDIIQAAGLSLLTFFCFYRLHRPGQEKGDGPASPARCRTACHSPRPAIGLVRGEGGDGPAPPAQR